MIKQDNILIASILHMEASGDCAKRYEAQFLIESKGRSVGFYHCIELHEFKVQLFGLFQTVAHQLFSDFLTPAAALYGIAGIGDMAAAPYIVGVQDVES